VGLRRSGLLLCLNRPFSKRSDSGFGRLKEGKSSGFFAGLGRTTTQKPTFADVLQRLPAMTTQNGLGALLPSRWQRAAAAGPVADVEATVCLR